MLATRPILLVICVAIAVSASGQLRGNRSNPPTVRQLVDADEVFHYRVEYGIFTLGTVTIEVAKDTTWKGRPAFILLSKIKSNPRLLFVGDK